MVVFWAPMRRKERAHHTLTTASPALEKRSGPVLSPRSSASPLLLLLLLLLLRLPPSDRNRQSTVRLWAWMVWTSSKEAMDQTTISPVWVPAKMYSSLTARARTESPCLSWCSSSGVALSGLPSASAAGEAQRRSGSEDGIVSAERTKRTGISRNQDAMNESESPSSFHPICRGMAGAQGATTDGQ
ncbi:hypothetical protein VTK73DRAFT_5187 [Phialemonium thermophilum]|uniref:Uncharacterized protein n=1 Tax=Phialemonium thermophilum TaxID=223376 RepID=A0ABR3V303_9PEZI